MRISTDYVLSCSLQAGELYPQARASLPLQSEARLFASCCLHCIHSVFSCVPLSSFYLVDLWDDFHLLLVQEFEAGTILIAVGTPSAPPLPLP